MLYETYLEVMNDYPMTPETGSYEVHFFTEPGVSNYYIPPDRVPVIRQVYVGELRLQESGVGPDVLASMYNYRSRPGFFTLLDRFIFLYPTPDAAYAVHVMGVPTASHFYYGGSVMHEHKAMSEYQAKIEKSVDLMLDWLSPAQRESLLKDKYFTVVGSDSKKKYRIHAGVTFNVRELDAEDKPVTKLCFQPAGAPYLGDVMLAQKLTLEADEQTAIKVANKHSVETYNFTSDEFNELIASRHAARQEKPKKRVDRKKRLP